MTPDTGTGKRISDRRRQVVVFASQCREMPRLSFLPPTDYQPGQAALKEWRLVFDLYEQLIDPRAGGCQPVEGLDAVEGLLLAEPGLVINPTMEQAEKALEAAIDKAAQGEALLLVYYVGHGKKYEGKREDRHLLQVIDTAQDPVDTGKESRGFDPYTLIRARREHVGEHLTGLVLIIDACQASSSAELFSSWIDAEAKFRTAWMGSSRLEPAYDGCFTRTLTELLREGVARGRHPNGSLVTQLRADDLAPLVESACSDQKPVIGGYQYHDPAMYVASNRAADQVLTDLGLGGSDGEFLLRLTARYHPYQLQEVIRVSEGHRLSVVLGGAGSGKSTLAAALRQPPAAAGVFSVDAVGFLSLAPTVDKLAETLHRQLATIPRFKQAAELHERSHRHEWDTFTVGEQLLAGPLSLLKQPVTLVIDAFDRLEDTQRRGVWDLVTRLTTGEQLKHVHVIGTSRPTEEPPDYAHRIELGTLDKITAGKYLTDREIASGRHGNLISLAQGNWLVLELAADYEVLEPEKLAGGDGDLGALYESMLESVKQRLDWEGQLQPVLAVLSAAIGDGPTLPFPLFAQAVGHLGGPATRSSLYEVLADPDLYRLIDRARPGTDAEHLGLFHATLTEWLVDRGLNLNRQRVHLALYEAIQEIAPREARDPQESAHQYAVAAEAEHAWEAERREDVVPILNARELSSPRQNLGVWQGWLPRIERVLGPDAPDTLLTRNNIAYWTGETGDAAEALRLFQELLRDQERVLGPDAPATLLTRNNIAGWTGRTGDAVEALRLFQELLRDQERVLGPDAPDTLRTRSDIATWTGRTGDAAEAQRLVQEPLRDLERVLGPDAPNTLLTRSNIAGWTGRTGDTAKALRLFQELLPDQERVLGPDAPDTLTTRNNIAHWG